MASFAFACMMSMPATAQQTESVFGVESASVTFGPYVRAEIGIAIPELQDPNWLPAGFPEDPQIFFDLDADNSAAGSLALGYDWMNGFRAEGALSVFTSQDFSGDWSYTVPATTGPHASMEGSTRSVALMANGYYMPLEAMGQNRRVQPYVTAGIGFARNSMEDWTRVNPAESRPERSFEGEESTEFAWSAGFGVQMDLGRQGPDDRPVILELGYRFFDLGETTGSTVPLPGNGDGGPLQALSFDNNQQTVTIGIRMPLTRN
jgi:opacity protein-like surface antigen